MLGLFKIVEIELGIDEVGGGDAIRVVSHL